MLLTAAFNVGTTTLTLTFDRPVNHPAAPMSGYPSTSGAVGEWAVNGGATGGAGATMTMSLEELAVSAGPNRLHYLDDWITGTDGSVLQPFVDFPLTVT